MGKKITEYSTTLSAFGNNDLFDVSKKLSSSPDVWESQSCDFVTLKAAVRDNIYSTNGTLSADRTMTMAGFNLYMTGGNVGIGFASASARLEVRGSGTTNSTRTLYLRNSSGAPVAIFYDNSTVFLANGISIGNTVPGSDAIFVDSDKFPTCIKVAPQKADGDAKSIYVLMGTANSGYNMGVDIDVTGGTTNHALRVSNGNVGLWGSDYQAGVRVLFLGEVTTEPTSAPASGGIMWIKDGALKYWGSGGTLTEIATA